MATESLTTAHRRVLCDLIGERFDSPEPGFYRSLRSFDTGNDLIAVKEAIVANGKWLEFWMYATKAFKNTYFLPWKYVAEGEVAAWLLQPERFCLLCAEWKMGEEGK